MNREQISVGMDVYPEYLDITDDRVRAVIIAEIKQLKPGGSQSYPIKGGFSQGDLGKIGYKSNFGRDSSEQVDLDIVGGEEEGTFILFATCYLDNNAE